MTLFLHELRRDAVKLTMWTAVIAFMLLISVWALIELVISKTHTHEKFPRLVVRKRTVRIGVLRLKTPDNLLGPLLSLAGAFCFSVRLHNPQPR